ncbi:hypothetical protein [Vibrio gangliei]|uniref:hypothetical protein n=1 Tax=Vibrio gangliei TaxID=2077090 RepID=UPI000D014DB9|nr:hypothetical protein [Vibrio gangliei]
MKTLFEQMVEASVQYPLMTRFTEDLFEIDRDIIENDSVVGDKYIWILKGNGAGTWLYRLNSKIGIEMLEYTIKNEPESSEFFWLHNNGDQKSILQHISRSHALSLAKAQVLTNREPRRRNLGSQITHCLNISDPKCSLIANPKVLMLASQKGKVTITLNKLVRDVAIITVSGQFGNKFEIRHILDLVDFVDSDRYESIRGMLNKPQHFVCDGRSYAYPCTVQ